MFVVIEATGCPNACRHCGVDGRPPCGGFYSLDELREIAAEWGNIVYAHEPTAHLEFPEIFDPELCDYGDMLPTCGFGIARKDDYVSLLKRTWDIGFRSFSFTFHGLQEHHDWFTGRRGSFNDILLATRRSKDAGLTPQWQIFVDMKGLEDVRPFSELALKELGALPTISIPYHCVSSKRLWRYEELRPTLDDVRNHGIDKRVTDAKKSVLTEPDTLTAEAWLERWKQSTKAGEFFAPFEPETWPPKRPFEWLQVDIRRDRSIYFNPIIAPPIRLGMLADGKEALFDRLGKIPQPSFVDVTPQDAKLTDEERVRLHPKGYSLRALVISKMRQNTG